MNTDHAQSSGTSDNPVHLLTGQVYHRATDISIPVPGMGSWTVDRSLGILATASPGIYPHGQNWIGHPADVRLYVTNGIALIAQGGVKRSFSGSGPTYVAPEDSYMVLVHDAGNAEFVLTDKDKNYKWIFHDFTVGAQLQGRIKEQTTLELAAQSLSGFVYSYNMDGTINQITSPEGHDHSLVYTWDGSLVTRIQVKDAGNNVLQQADYTYYEDVTSPSTDLGPDDENLVQVKISQRATNDTGSTLSIVRYTQYRYTATSKIKAIYEHDDIQRILATVGGLTTPEDILSQADTYGTPDLQAFASKSYTYYTSNATTTAINTSFQSGENLHTTYGGSVNVNETGYVKSETIRGCGSCGTDGAVTKRFYYWQKTSSGAAQAVEQNTTAHHIVEDTEDAAGTPLYRMVYAIDGFNLGHKGGRILRRAFIQSPISSPKYWCESWKFKETGPRYRLAEHRYPSAHTIVDTASELRNFLNPLIGLNTWTNDTNTVNTSSGLIEVFEYDANGFRTGARVKQGSGGTAYYVGATDYGDGTSQSVVTASYSYPTQTTTRANGKQTGYAYTFWDGGHRQVKTKTTTLPTISGGQNGSGVATTTVEYYDNRGKLRWTKDGEGYINYYAYHPINGQLAYQAIDVDPSSMAGEATSGSADEWDAWTVGDADDIAPTRDGGLPSVLNLVTKTFYDEQGRHRKTIQPGGSEHFVAYHNTRTISFPYWDSGSGSTLLPIQISKQANGVQTSEQIAVRAGYTSISTSSSAPTGFSSEPGQSDYVRWTKFTHDSTSGRLKFSDRYHDIPSSGDGTLSTNFYRTAMQYDEEGRVEYMIQVVSGSSASDRKEQVTQSVYDVLGRVIEVKQGVSGDSAANSHNMTDDYDTYPTLVTISKTEYDANGIGDGHVTKIKNHFGTGTNDFTGVNYKRTYRGHVRGIEPFYMNGSTETAIGPFTVNDVDWMGRTTSQAVFDAVPTWSTVLTGDNYSAYAASTSTNRRTRNDTFYDDLGRMYQTRRYKIAAGSGSGSDYLLTDFYFDRNNQQVGIQPAHAAGTETAYDGAGRAYQVRTVLNLESTKYSSGVFQYRDPVPKPSLGSMSGGDDWVIEMSHSVFDVESINTESHTFENNHDDVNTANRGIDLSNNDDYVRRSVYSWYDDADRLIVTADYGSGDTTAGAGTWKYASIPSRPGTAPTASSDTKLVTLFGYNADTGESETQTDPADIVTKTFYDDLGRQTYVAENFDNFSGSSETGTGDSTDKSKDRVTKSVYNGLDSQTQLVAMDANADGTLSDNQVTKYLYEDAANVERVTNVIYPDSADATSSGTDQIKLEYDVDGSAKKRTDQRGTVLDYTYTIRRQLEFAKVATLGGDTDGHVRSIKRSYDNLARLEKLTSYENSDGTGTIRNEVQYEYNDLNQVTKSYQSHEGSVSTMTTPNVQYTYDDAVTSNVFTRQHRLESLVYPNGRAVFHDYDSSNADYPSNRLSRIMKIRDTNASGAILAHYEYNGIGFLAVADLPEPDVKLDYFQGTSGAYAGYDRFGRVVDQYWKGYGSTSDVDRFRYAYDYASNRIYRDIDSSIYSTNNRDQAYELDGLHRLKMFDEGTLSGSTISGSPTKEEDWTLDALGNWAGYLTKTAGSTDLDQARTHSAVNEITNVSESTGPSWATPAHDAAGNMTTIPKPANPTGSFNGVYDAFNRLVTLSDGETIIAEYEYDGINARILRRIYTDGLLDYTRHAYYSEQWQLLEERVDSSPNADRQFVWAQDYIDDLILRDRNADGDSGNGLEERIYATHDALNSVTTLLDSSGSDHERYSYDAYGSNFVLDSGFGIKSNGSDFDWEIRFTGREYDIESDLYNFRLRYFHATLGRFTARDPIASDPNLYGYALDNPVISVDPLGLACQRFQRKYNIQLKNWRGGIPIIGPIGIYGSIGLKAEVDFGLVECDVCCGNGKVGKERTLYARGRFGFSGSITAGWEGSADFGGGKFSGYIGIKGEAWAYANARGQLRENTCKGKPKILRVCGTVDARFRLYGGAMFRFQYGRWFSWDIGVQAYGQVLYRGAGGCLLFSADGLVGTESNSGTWSNPVVYLEGCAGACYRYQIW